MKISVSSRIRSSSHRAYERLPGRGRRLRSRDHQLYEAILRDDFLNGALDVLRRNDLDPRDIEFDINEASVVGRTGGQIELVLRKLQAIGVSLALNHSDIGSASLRHLSELPIHRLKTAGFLTKDIEAGTRRQILIRSIISVASGLGMESFAETLETDAQLEFLKSAGCDAGQGFVFSRPFLSPDEAVAYLRTNT